MVAARQIKRRDPTITVLVWFDSVHIYEQDTTLDPDLEDHPGAWETGCTSGNFHGAPPLSPVAQLPAASRHVHPWPQVGGTSTRTPPCC